MIMKSVVLSSVLSLASGVAMAADLPTTFALRCDGAVNYSRSVGKTAYRVEATLERAKASAFNEERLRMGFNVASDELVTEVRAGSVKLYEVREDGDVLIGQSEVLSRFHESFEIIPTRTDDHHGRLLTQFDLLKPGTPIPSSGILSQLEIQTYYQIDAQGNLTVAPASISNSFMGLVYALPGNVKVEYPFTLRNCTLQ